MSEDRTEQEQPRQDQPGHDQAPSAQAHSLGEMLRAAREAKGQTVEELSRATAVRADYLLALEEDRHGDLPEPVYVRNFIRLYARGLGLDPAAALAMYGGAPGAAAASAPAGDTRTVSVTPPAERAAASAPAAAPRRPFRVGGWLPILLLVAGVVALAVWGFNSTMFRPDRAGAGTGSPEAPADDTAGGTQETEAEAEGSAAASTVRLSVSTDPEGARVLVDAFPVAGLTPVEGALVTARDNRLIRIELEGYEPFEAPFDLTFDRNLSFVLEEAAEPAIADDDGDGDGDEPGAATSAAGTISVSVTDESWLEIYPGSERTGDPHVYTTAQPGDSWTFNLPVTIRAGNAAGVNVSVNGRDVGPLGSAGEISMATFTEDD